MDEAKRKAARNQALFREVNERIEDLPQQESLVAFLCECADDACTETIPLTREEYERVRASAVRFPIAPGHDRADVENVVQTNDRFGIVEKLGEGAALSRKLDPRS